MSEAFSNLQDSMILQKDQGDDKASTHASFYMEKYRISKFQQEKTYFAGKHSKQKQKQTNNYSTASAAQ